MSRAQVACAAGAALALAGCALSISANEGVAGGVPALHHDQVAAVVARYEAARDSARSAGDVGLLAEAETAVSYRVDAAAMRAGDAISPAAGLDGMQAYIPKIADYPRWFVLVTTSTEAHAPSLLVFVRERAVDRWRRAAAIDVPDGVPPLAIDAEGYAMALTRTELGDAHAAVLSGAAAADEQGFAADQWTEELRASAADDRKRFSDAEVTVTDQAADLPRYALRTANGGALAFYATERTFSGTSGDRGWQLKGVFAALAGADEYEHTLDVHWLYQWVTLVPPADGSAVVIGRSGGIYAVDGE